MTNTIYDVVIIGGGSAGYTAGIYAAREGLKTIILEKEMTGGIAGITDMIENYPGFPDGISGPDLMEKFKKQAERFNVIFEEYVEVEEIVPQKDYFQIKSDDGEYHARSVILATGGYARKLGLEQEKKLAARGVSYCATCDGPFFKDAEIAVVGGGDAAIQEALYLTKFAKKVTIVHRRDKLRAADTLQQRAFKNEKIDIAWDSIVDDIVGETKVEALKLKNVKTGKISELNLEGVFIFTGWLPNSDFVKNLVEMDEQGYIKTDRDMNTSVKGIFAAGDVCMKSFRQIATAVGEATTAALSASHYLDGLQ